MIQYLGKNLDEGRRHPEAYFYYDGEKEQEKADKVFDLLESYGYEVIQEEECASIAVDNKYEYSQILKDYKYAKKAVKS